MKKFLAILLIAMIVCEEAEDKSETLQEIIGDTLQEIYEALEKLGIIDLLRSILDEGKKAVVKLCCTFLSKKQCKEFCQKIYGML